MELNYNAVDPIYERIAEKLKDNDKIVFGSYDIYEN